MISVRIKILSLDHKIPAWTDPGRNEGPYIEQEGGPGDYDPDPKPKVAALDDPCGQVH